MPQQRGDEKNFKRIRGESMKNNTQPALKERIEKALEDFTKGRASMHVPPLDTDVDVVLAECSDRLSELKARCAALAAENAGLKDTLSAVIDRSNEPDYQSIGMGCGVEDNGLQTDGYNACEYGWREAMDRIYSEVIPDTIPETPATDAFLDEVRASAIPEGYTLVPQQIIRDPSDIESICSQCGDGHESGYGDFTDGLLWVGNIQRDDGSIVHGMHISSADYSEEGGVTVCEFADQIRKGVQS